MKSQSQRVLIIYSRSYDELVVWAEIVSQLTEKCSLFLTHWCLLSPLSPWKSRWENRKESFCSISVSTVLVQPRFGEQKENVSPASLGIAQQLSLKRARSLGLAKLNDAFL